MSIDLHDFNRSWLTLQVESSNGGEYASEYSLDNFFIDDRSVYCSRLKQNVNVILSHKSSCSDVRVAPFELWEIQIRVPSMGFTSPLKNGFIFVCTDSVSLSTFDHYDEVDTSALLSQDHLTPGEILPPVPPCVKTVLYFQFDRHATTFKYKFQSPVKDTRYVFLKMLSSFGTKDNIDVEFIGLLGRDEEQYTALQGRGCLMSSIQKTFLISSISALAVCGISWALYSKYKKANKGMKPESCATDYDLATEARSQGNKFFREGKYSEAIDCYNRAISLYPTGNVDLALAYANRAAAFMAMNNFSSAQHDCDVAIEIDPYFSKAIDRRSRINYHTGQFEEALYDALAAAVVDKLKNLKFSEHLEKCLFKNRQHLLPHESQVSNFLKTFPCNEIAPQCGIEGVDHEEISQFRALIKASDFDAAFSLAKNSVLDAHTSTEMLEWLGTFELLSGDFESSEKTLIQAQSQAGSTVSLLIKLALVYMEMGDYSKMMELFETAIQVDPNNPAIYYHRGEIYSLSNDLESAISEFSRAIELDPGFVPAYVHQARAYLAKDMISTAKSVLESALQHLQDNSEILHVLGECYALEGDIDRSIAIFDRVICLSPNSPQYLLSKSIVISKGDHGNTSQEFEKQLLDIVEKFPRFDAARLQLAGYYADINNFDAAFEQYNIVTAHARTYQEIWVICTVRSLCKAQAYVIGKYPELSSEVQRILGSL